MDGICSSTLVSEGAIACSLCNWAHPSEAGLLAVFLVQWAGSKARRAREATNWRIVMVDCERKLFPLYRSPLGVALQKKGHREFQESFKSCGGDSVAIGI